MTEANQVSANVLEMGSTKIGHVWAENNNGEYLPVRFYTDALSADSIEDAKTLNDIDWKKIGLTKSGLTQIHGTQDGSIRDKNLKKGDIGYLKDRKKYAKIDKL